MAKNKNTVLSFSRDQDSLARREEALRNGGFEVISVKTESQARFEIEMGRCGVLVVCYTAGVGAIQDLTKLFRRRCPAGSIVFVMKRTDDNALQEVDYVLPIWRGRKRSSESWALLCTSNPKQARNYRGEV